MKIKSFHSFCSIFAISSRVATALPLILLAEPPHAINKRQAVEAELKDEYTISNLVNNFGVIEWIGLIIILWAILMLTSAIIFLAYKFLKTNKDLPNEEKAEQSEQEMDREIFDSYDTDKDGRLDANELKHFLKDMECINEHDSESLKNDLVNKLMDDIDENRDKKISFQEYRNYTDKL